MSRELLQYKVGALMYVPALNIDAGRKACSGAFDGLNALAFCLEDAITDTGVKEAEVQLVKTLEYISEHRGKQMPLLFVRVRGCTQFRRLPALLGELMNLLTGVIFPKFDLSNAAEYCAINGKINSRMDEPLFFMPILESGSIIQLRSRERTLLGLRELLDVCRDYVLNIRVGAMDFCKAYGLRRTVNQTVYDIAVLRDVIADILTVFSDEYVVSAPVWEYFSDDRSKDDWSAGMERELQLDIANGFIGKTVIHPSQIGFVNKWLKPLEADVSDAMAVLNWGADKSLGVAKSANGSRMNELATHLKWAQKIMVLSQIYGARFR